ncbi:hypothetical protein M8J77_018004 [Diaphorina citri]|nr:hypothetical protein M8J77_018004 [Diaphorina citri]
MHPLLTLFTQVLGEIQTESPLPVYPLNSSSTPSTFVFSSYNGSGPRTLFLSSKSHYDLTVLTSWLCTLGCMKPDIRLLQL